METSVNGKPLPQTAKVVVIGGGVIGCSVLYHLARIGVTDALLLERMVLTCGSSWHAAGQIHTINGNANLSSLQMHTLGFYPELEQESGQSVGLHRTGVIYLASTTERMDYLKQERGKARHLGSDMEFISLDEVRGMHPLIDTRHYKGALFDPLDGRIDPASVVQAYAKAARQRGSKVFEHTKVETMSQRSDGSWDVQTDRGTVHCEMVVNAGGLWGRDVGRMIGLELPIQAMGHQYIITEPLKELEEFGREVPGAIDYEANVYTRQEGKGFLLGTYEEGGIPWSVDHTPWDFGHELLPDNLEQIAGRLEVAFDRFPALQRAGIKSVIHGPFCFAPDGNPVVGPVPGVRNYFVAVGSMAGFCQGAGIGKALAEWMIEGEPEYDVTAMDVARFGQFATHKYTVNKVIENFGRRFMVSYPNEQLPAMRGQRTTPIYDLLKDRGAVFGAAFGLEHVLWYAPEGVEPAENPTFRRSNAFEHVGREVRAVRDSVGVIELANYSKYEIEGPHARAWLDGLLAGRLPKPGRLSLTPMLSPKGRLLGDFTIACLGEERFMIFGSGIAQSQHMRWFLAHLPETGVSLRNRSSELVGLGISGPRARDLLTRLSRKDVGPELFKFRDIKEMEVGGVPATIARVSFTGELGYEIYCTPEYLRALYMNVLEAGDGLGLTHFGGRALMSMRLEKGFGVWSTDFRSDFTAEESGLAKFIDFSKEGFVGRDAAFSERERGAGRRMVTLVVDTDEIDCNWDEPILDRDGNCVGLVTSGGYGHSTGKSLAIGYVAAASSVPGSELDVEIVGAKYRAVVQGVPLHDPDGERMRA
ncbi:MULTISPECIES: FAD-dependent oxidoreductase [Mesorhizobium]|uniref:GcvT family protein n=1 Tax=Mesorhizobium TaxID=68287 RepID=UPI0003CDDD04|nr:MULTISPECIES: FAD-dependent oxidoreductase [Mesorhizobium]ESY64045.1 glycine cleavage system protein T [Mesorhizobium sp. LNHC232B00]WJI35755.1 FAD-dependent oxidoreductase [Mesorhizobium opportunistum]